MSPSPEVEAAVREAFEAVLGLSMISDRSNEDALAFDIEAAAARAREFATEELFESEVDRIDYVQLVSMGPENPVQCRDYETCRISRVTSDIEALMCPIW